MRTTECLLVDEIITKGRGNKGKFTLKEMYKEELM